MQDHYYGEFQADLSIGAQASFKINHITLKPELGPYLRGLGAGFNINLGSTIIRGVKVDKSGIENTKHGKVATQGVGITIGGVSFDYDRRLSFGKTENAISVTSFGMGFKWNITSGDFIVGFMPKGSFSIGLGGKVEMISGFKF